MNSAKSNDRANRFKLLRTSPILERGIKLLLPDATQHQLVITDGVMRLLEPSNDRLLYPVRRASNPGNTWSHARFRNEGPKLLINGVGSRGAGSRVSSIIGLGETPDESLEEAIEALVMSLRYPQLEHDQVKREHRELLARYGYLK